MTPSKDFTSKNAAFQPRKAPQLGGDQGAIYGLSGAIPLRTQPPTLKVRHVIRPEIEVESLAV